VAVVVQAATGRLFLVNHLVVVRLLNLRLILLQALCTHVPSVLVVLVALLVLILVLMVPTQFLAQ
jgi:hypothetical protein